MPAEHDFLITIRWDNDENRPVYDLGDMDDYSAVALIGQIAADIRARWPDPRHIDDPLDSDQDDEDDH